MTGTDTLLREPAVQAVGWALLHFVWQGTVVGLLSAVALRLLRSSAADVRYVVASIGLALMATLPVVTGVQAWRSRTTPAVVSSSAGVASPSADPTPASAQMPSPTAAATSGCELDACSPVAEVSGRVERWLPMVVVAWMAGVALLALRLAGGWLRVYRMKTHGSEPADAGLHAIVRRLARTLHLTRPVTLLQSAAVDVPTVIGWLKPAVLVPVSAFAGLSPLQIEAILAHELAHIRRHDYAVNLLQSLLETLLFYHPAVWWLSRRIRIEREHCCDDLAVSLCGDPLIYARALADLEELRGANTQLAMAANGGVLLDRVRRLLAAPATHAGRGPAWIAAVAAVLLMVAIVGGSTGRQSVSAADLAMRPAVQADALPAAKSEVLGVAREQESTSQQPPPAPPAPPPPPPPVPAGETHVNESVHNSQHESSGTFSWSSNGEKISVNYRGSFTLNDTDTDIVRISPGGSFEISDGGRLGGRSVEFSADGSGNIVRRFRVGNTERPYEPEGREWLAKILPRFVRQSGFGAKERVARFLSRGGPAAVLAEISQIDTDYGKKVYFTQLMQQSQLDAATARTLFEQAGREIDSDYELATTLMAGAAKLLIDDGTRQAYFAAARSLESDYEMRRALTAALQKGPVSAAVLTGLLDATRELDSDYEAATLLLKVVADHQIEGAVRAPFFGALGTIDSAYEKGRVLQALLRANRLSAESLAAVIDAAVTGSDYETAQVLLAAARSQTITGPARDAYVRVAEKLGDYERDRALAALVRSEK
jgi:beta-lactamase regulating signal transducer with metallopeptidase domain